MQKPGIGNLLSWVIKNQGLCGKCVCVYSSGRSRVFFSGKINAFLSFPLGTFSCWLKQELQNTQNMTSATDFDHLEIQQQYSRINARWEASDDELDNDNSSARLFERSRIKALAGRPYICYLSCYLSHWSLTFCFLWSYSTLWWNPFFTTLPLFSLQ